MEHQPASVHERRLQEMLHVVGLELDAEQLSACVEHMLWVLATNESINLTAITDPETALRLHVVDSLVAVPEVAESPPGPLCDVGSGGGFPGVPLAIAGKRDTLLLDSVGKKVRALQAYLETSGLSPRVRAESARAEELALESPNLFASVTMRAVSNLASLVELAAPLLMRGGRLVALKGDLGDAEIAASQKAARICGLEMISVRRIALPEGHESRSIVSYAAISAPSISLPRRNGLAQSKPLAR